MMGKKCLTKPNNNVYFFIKKEGNYHSKYKPNYFIHAAAISRPMEIHEKNIINSIETNINPNNIAPQR